MPRKTGDLRREQQPTVRPKVAGIIRADAREKRKQRREYAAQFDRKPATTNLDHGAIR